MLELGLLLLLTSIIVIITLAHKATNPSIEKDTMSEVITPGSGHDLKTRTLYLEKAVSSLQNPLANTSLIPPLTGIQTIGAPPNNVQTFIQGRRNYLIDENFNQNERLVIEVGAGFFIGPVGPPVDDGPVCIAVKNPPGNGRLIEFVASSIVIIGDTPDLSEPDTSFLIKGQIQGGIAYLTITEQAGANQDEIVNEMPPVFIAGSPFTGFTAISELDLQVARDWVFTEGFFDSQATDLQIGFDTDEVGEFSITLEKGTAFTEQVFFNNFTFVGIVPDFNQAGKTFFIQGSRRADGTVTAVAFEQGAAGGTSRSYQSITLDFNEDILDGGTDIDPTSYEVITALNAAIAPFNTLPIVPNGAGDAFRATEELVLKLSFHGVTRLTGTDRGSVIIRAVKKLQTETVWTPIPGAYADIYAGRLQTSVPKGNATCPPIGITLQENEELRFEVTRRGQTHNLEDFRFFLEEL